MPKQVLELKTFHEGMVSHPDSEDINLNAAVLSNNIDSNARPGVLKGKRRPKFIRNWGPPATVLKFVGEEYYLAFIPQHITYVEQDGVDQDGNPVPSEYTIQARLEFTEEATLLQPGG